MWRDGGIELKIVVECGIEKVYDGPSSKSPATVTLKLRPNRIEIVADLHARYGVATTKAAAEIAPKLAPKIACVNVFFNVTSRKIEIEHRMSHH